MTLLQGIRSLFRGADAGNSTSAPPVPDTEVGAPSTDGKMDNAGGVPDNIGTVAYGIGDRPVLQGHLVWNLETQSCEWKASTVSAPKGTASVSGLDEWFPERADEDAAELYEALITWGYGNWHIAQLELEELYKVLCQRVGKVPGPWNRVGAALRRITRGKKTYPRTKFTDGKSRRVRSYYIPMPAQENVVAYRARPPEARSVA